MTLNDAVGTTKAINLTTNITALVVFLINGKVLLPLGIAAGCCNIDVYKRQDDTESPEQQGKNKNQDDGTCQSHFFAYN